MRKAWIAHEPEAALQHATALDEQSLAGLNARAWAYYRNADFAQAETAARAALKRNGQHVDARVILARCLLTRNAHKKATEHLEKAFARAPDHPYVARLLAGRLDLNTDRTRVLELTRRFVQLNPPGQDLFVEHQSRAIKLVEVLGARRLDERPADTELAARIEWPMEVKRSGPFVEVQLGDLKRTMLLDTGEESLTVSAATVKALNLKPLAEFPSVTAGGVTRMKIVLLPTFKVGAFEVNNVLAHVGTDDILGPGIFTGYRVRMELARRQLVLIRQPADVVPGADEADLAFDADTAARGTSKVRFRKLGRMIWIPVSTPAEAAHKPLAYEPPRWALLDTGCGPAAILMPRYFNWLKRRPGAPLALPVRTRLGGADGEGAEQIVQVMPDLRLRMLGGEVSAAESLSAPSFGAISKLVEAELSAIVGWPILWRQLRVLEIDYERCTLTAEPRFGRMR